jgi:hypothetical protein
MSKKHFIALADAIRDYNRNAFPHGTNTASPLQFTHTQILSLATFCASQNFRFNKERWLDYIAGKCGPNGGSIKAKA